MINRRIFSNNFETYEEVAQGFQDLIEPLSPFFADKNRGRLDLGEQGTVYSKSTRDVEAFLRPLWGLGPYLTQNESPFLEKYLQGIIIGTNPEHSDYWGKTEDFDQLIVEMASLSIFFLLNKEQTWDRLTKQQQQNLHQWLIQVNQHQIPRNNWHFFRVLVNTAMKNLQMPYSQTMIESDLSIVDSFYLGDGWYCDGPGTQIDYYISFAIHYYSLLYCRFSADDIERVVTMKERASKFAQTFKYWFAENGEALPFGRSLAYRFAQVSFFSALVFADVEALPWGEIKGLISRHMKSWMNKKIFTSEGLLSIGYHYPDSVFTEGYNGPGSPYWSFKSFILLAVPKEHPYWQAQMQPLKIEVSSLAHPISRNFYQHNESRTHALNFPAGQMMTHQSHASAKYSKFVYSTHFGNSVPKSSYWYYEGAYDNCLAVAEDDSYFRTKGLDTDFEILDDRIVHQWHPWKDVAIRSTIIPLEGCHVRIHELSTERQIYAYDGGFSTPKENIKRKESTTAYAEVENSIGISRIENILGFRTAGIVRPEPNTNLFYPLTLLPHVKTKLEIGKHLLISLVIGTLPEEEVMKPEIIQKNSEVYIKQGSKEIRVFLKK